MKSGEGSLGVALMLPPSAPAAEQPARMVTPRGPMARLRRNLRRRRSFGDREQGFTLLELIIVIALIGILASIALPGLRNPIVRSKEAALKTNLRTMRDALDQHYADKGSYPSSLDALVEEGYLRKMPNDPMTGEADWVEVLEEYDEEAAETDYDDFGQPGIVDLHSASEEVADDGTPYAEW